MKSIFALLLTVISLNVFAQEISYEVIVSKSEILAGNKLKVTYKITNGEPLEFTTPQFIGFELLSGPNTSSQYSSMNGKVTQSVSYSFILLAANEGTFEIAGSTVTIDENEYSSIALPINVMPNPDGKIEPLSEDSNDPFGDFFNDNSMFNQRHQEEDAIITKPKKKRKVYKL